MRERNISEWLPLVHPLLGTWPATKACALMGNQTGDLSISRPALDPLSLTSQGCNHFNFLLTRNSLLYLEFRTEFEKCNTYFNLAVELSACSFVIPSRSIYLK